MVSSVSAWSRCYCKAFYSLSLVLIAGSVPSSWSLIRLNMSACRYCPKQSGKNPSVGCQDLRAGGSHLGAADHSRGGGEAVRGHRQPADQVNRLPAGQVRGAAQEKGREVPGQLDPYRWQIEYVCFDSARQPLITLYVDLSL